MSTLTKPPVLNSEYINQMERLNANIGIIAAAYGSAMKPISWAEVQALVRSGFAKRVFAIGDQLICKKDNVELVWDVLAHNQDTPADPQFQYSMTIQLHNIYAGVQFDEREAFYYTSSGLSAGTYNITVSGHDWVAADVGKTFHFTLTQAVPAGGQLVFTQAYNASLSTGSVQSFSAGNSYTPIETAAMSEGNTGTDLGSITSNTTTASMNCMQRALLGSNNYKASAIRQWLNSDKAAGSVWSPQTNFDRAPSWRTSLKGWMNGLDADFLAVVGKTKFNVAKNTVCDGGGYDTLSDKFFLVSRENVFAGKENNIDEGGAYPYYSDYSDYQSASTGADKNRVKYLNGSASWWWLRSPHSGYAVYPRLVGNVGYIYGDVATYSIGAAPACNII